MPWQGFDRLVSINGLEGYRNTQGELLRPFTLSLLAEAHVAAGARDAAEDALREAIAVSHTLEAEVFVPGLQLRLARILNARDLDARDRQRRDLLRAALTGARAQGAEATAAAIERTLDLER